MPTRFKATRFWAFVTAFALTAATISAGSAAIGDDSPTIAPIPVHSSAI